MINNPTFTKYKEFSFYTLEKPKIIDSVIESIKGQINQRCTEKSINIAVSGKMLKV